MTRASFNETMSQSGSLARIREEAQTLGRSGVSTT